MNMLQTKSAERELLVKERGVLTAKEDWSDEDLTAIETKNAAIIKLDGEIARLQEIEKIKQDQINREALMGETDTEGRPGYSGESNIATKSLIHVPIEFKSITPRTLSTIAGISRDEAQETAYGLGMWLCAAFGNTDSPVVSRAKKWCKDSGIIITKAQSENDNTLGAFLVPTVLSGNVIALIEKFGIVRKIFRMNKMTSDNLSIPRRTGGPVAYWVTDNTAVAASNKTWDLITLNANKLMMVLQYSTELSEDAIINMGDDLAREIGIRFSYAEDHAGLLGTGTSADGGFTGLITALGNAFNNVAGAGLIVGSAGTGADWTGFLMANFNAVQGALPELAWQSQPSWLCTRQFYSSVMVKLLVAGGGNTVTTLAEGPMANPQFLGCPVQFAQVMPRSTATNTIVCLFGAYDLSSEMGDRRALTIATSDQFAFGSDQLSVRGTERVSFNTHDVGGSGLAATAINPGNTAGAAVSGPVVGLQTASS